MPWPGPAPSEPAPSEPAPSEPPPSTTSEGPAAPSPPAPLPPPPLPSPRSGVRARGRVQRPTRSGFPSVLLGGFGLGAARTRPLGPSRKSSGVRALSWWQEPTSTGAPGSHTGETEFERLMRRPVSKRDIPGRDSDFERLMKQPVGGVRRPRPPTDFERLLKRSVGGIPRIGGSGVLIPEVLQEAVKVITRGEGGPPPPLKPGPGGVYSPDLPVPAPSARVPPAKPSRPPPSTPPPRPPVLSVPAPAPNAPRPRVEPAPVPRPGPIPFPPVIVNKPPTRRKASPAPKSRPISRSQAWPNALSRMLTTIGAHAVTRRAKRSPVATLSVPGLTALSQTQAMPSPSAEPPAPRPGSGFSASPLTALSPWTLSSPPPDCRCPKPRKPRKRKKRPSNVIAKIQPFERRMSKYSLENLRRG